MVRRRLTTDAKKKRRRKRRLLLGVGCCLLFLVLVVGAVAGFRHPRFLIDRVIVSGASVLEEEHLQIFAKEALRGNYLFIIPRRNTLVAPRGALERELRASFSRIQNVDVKVVFPDTLKIVLQEHQPYGLWCGEREKEIEGCYFLSSSGYVYAEAPRFSDNIYIRYFGPLSNEQSVRAQFMRPETFEQVDRFRLAFEEIGLEPPRQIIASSTDDVTFVFSSGTRVFFDLSRPLEAVFADFETAILSSETELSLEGFPRLEYLDLRFDDKMFYSFGPLATSTGDE